MRMGSRTRLLFCTAGVAATAMMALLGFQTTQPDHTAEMSVPVAGPMQLGETITQSASPSVPDVPSAAPPVKAQPAPTAEPG
ncbi:hypothetical protein M2272_001358 [Mycobacterium frederiksbergense]|uniref:Fibronectin attachment protein n=1 Tax=Mycolicibacterium frederiksbergense TaxID=117567 RepID=A0ABT6KVI4_9MYCO|nr:hypothetical protein [Mycolicibacterium frederiksbergense]